MTQEKSGSSIRRRYLTGLHAGEPHDPFERAIESLQHSVELHTHLKRQRPARVVVRCNRRTSRVGKVVGVILGFKHVANKRTEGLCGFDDVRSGRILLARNLKPARRTVHRDTVLDQSIHELRDGWKVSLHRGHDVPPWVTIVRVTHHIDVPHWQAVPSPAPKLRVLLLSLCRRLDSVEHFGMDGPVVAVPPLNRVPPHPIDVVQQRLPIPRRVVHHRTIGRNRVID